MIGQTGITPGRGGEGNTNQGGGQGCEIKTQLNYLFLAIAFLLFLKSISCFTN